MWKNRPFRWSTAMVVALLLGGAVAGIAGAAGGLHGGGSKAQGTPAVGKVAATNPDGHCVMLPSVSDIVKHPEKHPGWQVIGGQCGAPTPTPSGATTATPTPSSAAGKVAAANPAGHCVMLPSVSDIVRHPEKHPRWHVIGGQCGTGTSTPTATPSG